MLAAALAAFTFSVALLPAVRDVGVTEALAPLGVPDTARLIVPPVPTTAVEMVLEPLAPCNRLKLVGLAEIVKFGLGEPELHDLDRKSTRLNSSHDQISYAVFCLKKKKPRITHDKSAAQPRPIRHNPR